jgi:hypothetical protein
MKPRRTAYDFEKAVRSELGRWMSALRSALHFDARQKKVPAADIRRSFDNTISLPKSWSAGFSLRLNDQVDFRRTS